MTPGFFVRLIAGLVPVIARAGPAEDTIVAAMRLSENPNYSWVATVSDNARTYDIHGQTTREGYTRVRMPAINSVRRQLGRSVTDTQVEMIFRGNVDCMIETDNGWKQPGELVAPESSRPAPTAVPGPTVTVNVEGGTLPAISLPLPPKPRAAKAAVERHYSNLQLAISHPHEELGIIVSSHRDFVVEGAVVSGTLTDLGARLLLVRDGQTTITPVQATGTFKLWLRDGLVTRYQVKLEGTLHVQVSQGSRPITVSQVTDTTLKDIGVTRVVIPNEVRAILR